MAHVVRLPGSCTAFIPLPLPRLTGTDIMKSNLKPLKEQVIVITGASSGIGLATARLAARRGARVVLAARAEDALQQLETELNTDGKQAVYVVADVTKQEDVRRIAETAMQEFGAINTWVNDAGTSVYGLITKVPVEDERALFEVNYWGFVYGCRVAIEYMRETGGAIINLGSVASDRAIPLQGAYSASKHALKAYSDTLRTELQEQNIPISVTVVKPTAINTPFFEHAKNYMEAEPEEPSPMYTPDLVAKGILHAAEHPTRDLLIGDNAPLQSLMGTLVPKLGDKFMRLTMFKGQKSSRPAKPGDHQALEHPSGTLQEESEYEAAVLSLSPYTALAKHPVLKATALAAFGFAAGALLFRRTEK
jgi:short-subunit dehydrogenase